tara:strand:- start:1457 stop:1816 length:360 start_codon:yes stop_codon:yes gene_type:complete
MLCRNAFKTLNNLSINTSIRVSYTKNKKSIEESKSLIPKIKPNVGIQEQNTIAINDIEKKKYKKHNRNLNIDIYSDNRDSIIRIEDKLLKIFDSREKQKNSLIERRILLDKSKTEYGHE